MPTTLLDTLLAAPEKHLSGSDLHLHLPVRRPLLNELLAARPVDTPVREMYLDPEADNRVHLHLTVDVPGPLGLVRRRITFVPGEAVSFPEQPWLTLRIVDGLKFLDKPLLKLMRRQLERRLPAGIELTSDFLRVHVPALLTRAGYQPLVPLMQSLRLTADQDVLLVDLHFNSPSPQPA